MNQKYNIFPYNYSFLKKFISYNLEFVAISVFIFVSNKCLI